MIGGYGERNGFNCACYLTEMLLVLFGGLNEGLGLALTKAKWPNTGRFQFWPITTSY